MINKKPRLTLKEEESKQMPFKSNLMQKIALKGKNELEGIKPKEILNDSVSRILDSSMVQRMINNQEDEEVMRMSSTLKAGLNHTKTIKFGK